MILSALIFVAISSLSVAGKDDETTPILASENLIVQQIEQASMKSGKAKTFKQYFQSIHKKGERFLESLLQIGRGKCREDLAICVLAKNKCCNTRCIPYDGNNPKQLTITGIGRCAKEIPTNLPAGSNCIFDFDCGSGACNHWSPMIHVLTAPSRPPSTSSGHIDRSNGQWGTCE